MPSLRELQQEFAAALVADADDDARVAVYRNAVRANYRNALGATYRVVRDLTGAPFFNAAVDAYARAHPSAGGDLNVYGDMFGDFLAAYPHARELPYLPDVARLEWALDEAHRAADGDGSPERTLAELARVPGNAVAALRFALDPSCRLLRSAFPVLRIWQVHQAGFEGDARVRFDAGTDHVLVMRDASGVGAQRLRAGEFAWLAALGAGADLAAALDAALSAEATFDLGTALRARIADATLLRIAGPA
jgi:hypothetical protein